MHSTSWTETGTLRGPELWVCVVFSACVEAKGSILWLFKLNLYIVILHMSSFPPFLLVSMQLCPVLMLSNLILNLCVFYFGSWKRNYLRHKGHTMRFIPSWRWSCQYWPVMGWKCWILPLAHSSRLVCTYRDTSLASTWIYPRWDKGTYCGIETLSLCICLLSWFIRKWDEGMYCEIEMLSLHVCSLF